ncbi:unnamed protein product [Urochloa humidicola]
MRAARALTRGPCYHSDSQASTTARRGSRRRPASRSDAHARPGREHGTSHPEPLAPTDPHKPRLQGTASRKGFRRKGSRLSSPDHPRALSRPTRATTGKQTRRLDLERPPPSPHRLPSTRDAAEPAYPRRAPRRSQLWRIRSPTPQGAPPTTSPRAASPCCGHADASSTARPPPPPWSPSCATCHPATTSSSSTPGASTAYSHRTFTGRGDVDPINERISGFYTQIAGYRKEIYDVKVTNNILNWVSFARSVADLRAEVDRVRKQASALRECVRNLGAKAFEEPAAFCEVM